MLLFIMIVKTRKKNNKAPARRSNGTRKAVVNQPPQSAWEMIQQIVKKFEALPADTWENTPKDLAKNLDHYLYGLPKVDD